MKNKQDTVVLGFGAMGSALVRGWVRNRMIPRLPNHGGRYRRGQAEKIGGSPQDQNPNRSDQDSAPGGSVLLATKPQQMKGLLAQAGPLFPREALVVSIAAGISTRQIEKFLPQGCPVVRVMPNTPALLGAGMAAVAGGGRAKKKHVQRVLELFSAVGKAVEVREDQMDLVTALSGSGPAYFFHMVEIMVEQGVRGGLKPEVAKLLAAQTALGAARMILETGKTPEELRAQVTSPGGTTQAALEAMAVGKFKETVEAAIQSAVNRGAELRRMAES